MLFSITIPTYNKEACIMNAVHSAINQDYNGDYEIIIVDNASKDNTFGLLNAQVSLISNVRIIRNKETYDMFTNHNICLKEAKGDYVLFCHSDDVLLPNALSVLEQRIKKRNFPEKYILWGRSLFRDFTPCIMMGGKSYDEIFSGDVSLKCFLHGGLTPSGTCYSRESLLQIGGFPVYDYYIQTSDWAVMIVAAFNDFKFEMMNDIIFKRMDSSTFKTTLPTKEVNRIHSESFNLLFSILTNEQKQIYLNYLLKDGDRGWIKCVKRHLSVSDYYKYRLVRFFKDRLTI